ncbi:MAG: glycosyltransferase [Oscillospiraceae bacterium]
MKKPLRILEVNKFYPPHIGGIETLIMQRAEYFSSQPDIEVKVLVCQEQGKGIQETVKGVSVTRCGSMGTYFSCPLSFAFFRKFREMANWADVIEIHTPFPLGDMACLLSQTQKRVVIAWHSDVIRQKKLLKLYQPLLHGFLKRADAIITATQGHIDGSAFLPEFREKCHVIPYPFDPEPYLKANCSPILTRRLKHSDSVKLLFVGRLVYYKGVEFLLKAFRRVKHCELFLCGTGKLETELRQQAHGLNVHFLGKLNDKALKSAFSDCDILILPSVENSEAFGIVQQEAMIFGKPVINTALSTGVPFVSIDGKTGITVPPKDVKALAIAIQKLADSPELRKQYGDNAKKRILQEYDYKKRMQEMIAILAQIP